MHLNIRKPREAIQISQYELSKRAKLTPAYINNLESGARTNPSVNVLIKLAEALECTIDDLFDSDETAQKEGA